MSYNAKQFPLFQKSCHKSQQQQQKQEQQQHQQQQQQQQKQQHQDKQSPKIIHENRWQTIQTQKNDRFLQEVNKKNEALASQRPKGSLSNQNFIEILWKSSPRRPPPQTACASTEMPMMCMIWLANTTYCHFERPSSMRPSEERPRAIPSFLEGFCEFPCIRCCWQHLQPHKFQDVLTQWAADRTINTIGCRRHKGPLLTG